MARTRSDLQAAADQHAAQLRADLARDLRQARRDAGLTQRAVAAAAGVVPSVVSRLEAGASEPSFETYARVAAVLGADLSVRVWPTTGPAIHNRHSVPMADLVLGSLHPRWRPTPEVRVLNPSRGWVDLALHDPAARLVVATELEAQFRRVEQLLRWSGEKALALPSSAAWRGWCAGGGPPETSRLLVVRWTRSNREIATSARRLLEAAYPADPRDALAALTGTARWPGPALLWARIHDGRPALLEWRP
jgi:transcriptional regulator with XRE-family HTH domain